MEPPVRCSNRQVDLDQLTEGFSKWRETHQGLVLENSRLQQDLRSLSALREQDKITDKTSKEELRQLREIIKSLQDSLVRRCDLEEENKNLREHVEVMESAIAMMKEEGRAALAEQRAAQEQTGAQEREEMEENHWQRIKNLEGQLRSLEESLGERSAEVGRLGQKLADAEKSRQTEVVKLRLEYDAKLLKLQTTAGARTSLHRSGNDKPSSSVSSLIFREKMLNAQAASEREVATLRRTVGELKRKLEAKQPAAVTKRRR